jgi:hypothetical protein
MGIGNKPIDGGHFLFTSAEKEKFIEEEPLSAPYFRKWMGSAELIQGLERWCLFVREIPRELLANSPNCMNVIENVRLSRLESTSEGTRKLAERPERFHVENFPKSTYIVIPETSSERRKYLSTAFFEPNIISSNRLNIIDSFESYIFSLMSSRIHMNWVLAVGGRLETRISYSVGICYNTFPFPPISNQRKEELAQCTFRILEEREKHPEKTLAELYDPDKMPEGLKEAHRLNDEAVERCYRSTPFNSDEERLEYLFKLYEKMIQEEKEKGTLFESEKKSRKKK